MEENVFGSKSKCHFPGIKISAVDILPNPLFRLLPPG